MFCGYCGLKFVQANELEHHTLAFHQIKPLHLMNVCSLCPYTSPSVMELRHHTNSFHRIPYTLMDRFVPSRDTISMVPSVTEQSSVDVSEKKEQNEDDEGGKKEEDVGEEEEEEEEGECADLASTKEFKSLAISRRASMPENMMGECNEENFAETQNIFNLAKSRAIFAWASENVNEGEQTGTVELYCDHVVSEQIKKLIFRHTLFPSITMPNSPLPMDTVNMINEKSKTLLDEMAELTLASRRKAVKQKKLSSLESQVVSTTINLHDESKEISKRIDDESIESLLKEKAKYLKRSKLLAQISIRLLNGFSYHLEDKGLREIHNRLSHVDSL